jgi:hypothetical protein
MRASFRSSISLPLLMLRIFSLERVRTQCRRSCLIPCTGRSIKPTGVGRTPSSVSLKMHSGGLLCAALPTRTSTNARLIACQHTSPGSSRRSRSYRIRSANCMEITSDSDAGMPNWRRWSQRTRTTPSVRPQLIRLGPRGPRAVPTIRQTARRAEGSSRLDAAAVIASQPRRRAPPSRLQELPCPVIRRADLATPPAAGLGGRAGEVEGD